MSRLLATAALLLLMPLAMAPAAPIPEAAKKPILFHPTTQAKWVYQFYGLDDKVGREVVDVVMSVKKQDGVYYAKLGSVFDGKKQASGLVMAISPKGLTEGHESVVGSFIPSADILRIPFKAGDKWVIKRDSAQADKEQRYTSRGPEDIEVPAGKFHTLRVDTEYVWRDGSPSRKDKTWYAPNLGVVKWEDAEGRSLVLKSFEPGR